jgi:hypothetical protein
MPCNHSYPLAHRTRQSARDARRESDNRLPRGCGPAWQNYHVLPYDPSGKPSENSRPIGGMSETLRQEQEANATYAGERLNIDGNLSVCFLEQDTKVVPSWD